MSTTVQQSHSPAARSSRAPIAAGRLLRLELRHNVMVWLLPLMVGLFLLHGYRHAMAMGPFWALRATVIPSNLLIVFAPFVAGAAAWTSSRDGRRGTTDLIATTSRSRWTAQLLGWAGTCGWALLAYAACVAIIYGSTATQATWGGPVWWPVALGAAGVAAFTAIGYLAGALWPSRFTPPLAALGVFLAQYVAPSGALSHTSGVALLSLTSMPYLQPAVAGAGVFYPYPPDIFIVQTMLVGGFALAALGALGLPLSSGTRLLRRAALATTVAGLVALGVAVGLASTARLEAHGVVISALHAAADDQPIPYRPIRVPGQVPIYLHPACRSYATLVTTAFDPVLREVAGLPGAPVRAVQVSERFGLVGEPPVFHFSLALVSTANAFVSQKITELRLVFVDAFVGGGQAPSAPVGMVIGGAGFSDQAAFVGGPAQQAVEVALLNEAGVPLLSHNGAAAFSRLVHVVAPAPGSPVYAAATRFAALSPARRHGWLAMHLTELRAGQVTLAHLP